MDKVDQNRGVSVKTGGRHKGTPNRVTAELRAAITELVRGNIGNAHVWLDQVASVSPAKALELLMGLSRYALPELKAIAIDVQDHSASPREMTLAQLQNVIESDFEESESERLALPAPSSLYEGLV